MSTWVYDDGGRASAGRKGLTGDCVTRALAIAMRRPYEDVYADLAAGTATQRASKRTPKKGRTASRGINTRRKWFTLYMLERGWRWVPTMGIGTGCRVHLRDGELPMGRLIAAVSRHYCAVIDGVVHDTADPSRGGTRCVYGYWTEEQA